jgi:hypothetical protein
VQDEGSDDGEQPTTMFRMRARRCRMMEQALARVDKARRDPEHGVGGGSSPEPRHFATHAYAAGKGAVSR